MSKDRSKRMRQYRAPSQKAELLRQHHQDRIPISDLRPESAAAECFLSLAAVALQTESSSLYIPINQASD